MLQHIFLHGRILGWLLKNCGWHIRPPGARAPSCVINSDLFNFDDVGMLEADDDVELAGEELIEEVLGGQVVIDNLDRQVSSARQVHGLSDDGKWSLAELFAEPVAVLEEHRLQVDRTFHVSHLQRYVTVVWPPRLSFERDAGGARRGEGEIRVRSIQCRVKPSSMTHTRAPPQQLLIESPATVRFCYVLS